MHRLEIGQLVIGGIDAHAEEQPRVSPIYNLRAPLELDEIRLVFLVSRGDQAMDLEKQDRINIQCQRRTHSAKGGRGTGIRVSQMVADGIIS